MSAGDYGRRSSRLKALRLMKERSFLVLCCVRCSSLSPSAFYYTSPICSSMISACRRAGKQTLGRCRVNFMIRCLFLRPARSKEDAACWHVAWVVRYASSPTPWGVGVDALWRILLHGVCYDSSLSRSDIHRQKSIDVPPPPPGLRASAQGSLR